jgi:hypothetical protein
MTTVATRPTEDTSLGPVLYLAFELGSKTWKLAFTTGFGQRPRVPGRDTQLLEVCTNHLFGIPHGLPP